MLDAAIFREYDIRGIADRDLPDPDVELLGQAFGACVRRHSGSTVHLGRDCRLSSERLSEAFCAGLQRSGCDVSFLGTVPTPVLYHSAFTTRANGAVMITGSHNPAEYNGFKLMCGESALHGEQIQALHRMLEAGDLVTGAGRRAARDAITPYVEDIASRFSWNRRLKVVFDCGNGTTGPTLRRLLERLNVEPVELFFEMDGHFPNHHPDPTVETNLEALKKTVLTRQAEFGLSFDGDSDRLGAIDEHGNILWGDYLLLIFAREILTRKPGATIIGEVKCSQVLYDELERLGGRPVMYRTGHSLIKAKMREVNAELAGEMSGHMFFADRYYGFDDALYAACRLLEIVANSGQPLSAQTEHLPRRATTPELRIDCPDDRKFAVVAALAKRYRATHQVITIDGVRVLFDHGWGLVRASNTQPVLVLRFEAETREQLGAYRDEVEAAVAETLTAVV